jgi:hypothetical protein
MRTVGDPGVQGEVVTGLQGTGPFAATTSGLLGELHIPKGITCVIGAWSMIVAAGFLLVFTW